MRKSIWLDNVSLPEFKKLKEYKKTDVLIIGGGICGILCAYFLKQAGVDYILVEGKKIVSGITKNTTAKITSLHGLVYDKLIRKFGREKAEMYFKANEMAIAEYEKICRDIDCDFEKKSAFTYSITDRGKIEAEVKALISLGGAANFYEKTELPFKIKGAVCLADQAQFNPIKFISEIAKDLNIYEDTFIKEINSTQAVSDHGKINAKKIIIATHFPFINKHGEYFLKMYQHRSYVIALENTQELGGMYVDESNKGFSFRNYGSNLLLGGGGHRTGKQGGGWNELRLFKKQYYPKSQETFNWATQDCISLDSVPYIGKYSKNTPDLFVATGFNKWGITSSMVAAKILCDLVQDKRNDYADVFSPSRSILKPQLLVNGLETISNFAIPTVRRCPHLGCALKWNKAENSWDCTCHGSRFDERGKIIDNPAMKDAGNLKSK